MSDWAGIDPGSSSSAGRTPPRSAVPRRSSPPMHPSGRAVLGAIDQGGRLLQRRARVLVLGSVLFVVPVLVLELISTWLTFDRFDDLDGTVASLPELAGGIEASTGVETLLWYLSVVMHSLAVCLVGGFAAVVAADDRAGRAVTLAGSLRVTLGRLPALVGVWFLGHVWMLLAALVMVSADGSALTAAAVFGGPVIVLFVTLTLVAAPVVAIERAGPVRALRRSSRLVRRRFGAAFAFVVVSALVGSWVRFGVTFLPRLAEFTGLVTFGSVGWLVEGAAGQVARLLSIPLVAAATALCYLELRMQVEGLDLYLATERAFGDTT